MVGSLEFAAATFGSLVLLVLGHDECGAVKGAIDVVTNDATLPGEIEDVVAPILPAVQNMQDEPEDRLLGAAITENVRLQTQLLSQNAILADRVSTEELRIVGAEYDLETGKVSLVE